MKNKRKKVLRVILILLLLAIGGLFFPTWTSKIAGENSISELRRVEVNNASLEVMIRGNNRDNPIIIFIHGGPCCSEIPYVKKYQDLLEQDFTIVHYDQRGSGKSYQPGTDYSYVSAATHVSDLIALTQYIETYLEQDKVILTAHSYGTYIGTMAASQRPDLFRAYVGIGQMSDTVESESDSLEMCIEAARSNNNSKDIDYLTERKESVANGETITPRDYVRKYGFAAREIDEDNDYLMGFLFGSEYNLFDMIGFYTASGKYQDALIMEALNNPVSKLVTELNLPVYFVMGKYDGMTSPKAAEKYLNSLQGTGSRKMLLFDKSAHYPQFEEKEKFYEWMCSEFLK